LHNLALREIIISKRLLLFVNPLTRTSVLPTEEIMEKNQEQARVEFRAALEPIAKELGLTVNKEIIKKLGYPRKSEDVEDGSTFHWTTPNTCIHSCGGARFPES
jgi:hypothetical protein